MSGRNIVFYCVTLEGQKRHILHVRHYIVFTFSLKFK